MKYRDEIDKCYGVAGMSVALAILDAEDLLIGVTLDGDGLDCINMVPQYYSVGNPLLSPTSAWQDVFQRFQVTLGMTIADSMCRKMLHDKGVVDKKLRQALLNAACEEGKSSCQLENDEVERIFDKYFQYMLQTFKNRNVHTVITSMVERLKADRALSSCDVLEMLRSLN